MAARRRGEQNFRCEWINGREAFRRFATHSGGVQSARHIKPLHWYIACRLVLEGGFRPDEITPRPPFAIEEEPARGRSGTRFLLRHMPSMGGGGEQVILGGLKTKNVDVVVTKPGIGPVLAVSCKGVTKAFRNLSNRMEETIGECTNLHITYPAMVVGYLTLLRANRTIADALEAPETGAAAPEGADAEAVETDVSSNAGQMEQIVANDVAILPNGKTAESIVRFHAALSEMTDRGGIRDEISRYEAIAIALIEPKGEQAGTVISEFPPPDSPLRLENFFQTLYQRYEERFVFGAPLLAERGLTNRLEWSAQSPILLAADGTAGMDHAVRSKVL